MCTLTLPVLLIVLSVTLKCQEAAPLERLLSISDDLSDGSSETERWILPVMPESTFMGLNEEMPKDPGRETDSSHHLEKRKCNTATCVTQRLVDFLIRSSNNIGAIYSPTNVGSYTYGKRDNAGLVIGDPFNYL
uniref:Islet amyloid polypeptide n=1 Tax=Geotrypetes seraphini TaxID=260995 RepID=A0A6P8RT58_GEOSA|nr:islet amyloid polypeptide [Geotrypetes seraphini]